MFIFDYVSILVQVPAGCWRFSTGLETSQNVAWQGECELENVAELWWGNISPSKNHESSKMARLKMIQFFSPGLALSASKLDMLIYEHCCLVGAAVSWAMSRSFLIFGAPLRHLNPWEFCLAWDWNPSKRFANINCFRKSLKNAMARRNAAACFPLNQRMISHRLFTSPLHPGSWWTYQCTLLPWRLWILAKLKCLNDQQAKDINMNFQVDQYPKSGWNLNYNPILEPSKSDY